MDRQAVMGLLGSALLIWLIMNLGTKRFDRYFLPFYPLLDLAAGAGLAALVAVFSGKARWLGYALLAGLIGLQAGQLISVHPYYLSYYNPLLGGPARAPEVMMIGWGEGLDQAGRYLSAKPEAADLEVVAWYNQGPFSYFFSGASQHISINTPPSPARLAEILQADYIVVYINQWQRNAPADLLAALSGRQPEHTVWIDGLEYVRIYRMNP
jgi:4-amino-4-deoxy-L-arabinose transferase-like glycosyltransferase